MCGLSPFPILILKDRSAAIADLSVLFGDRLALKIPNGDGHLGVDLGFALDLNPPTAFVPLQKPTILAVDVRDDLVGDAHFFDLGGGGVFLHLRFHDILEHRIARVASQRIAGAKYDVGGPRDLDDGKILSVLFCPRYIQGFPASNPLSVIGGLHVPRPGDRDQFKRNPKTPEDIL